MARFRTLLCLLFASLAAAEEPRRRDPEDVARELLEVYGKQLDIVEYIPALAVACRIRFAELTGEERYLREAEQLIAKQLDRAPPAKSDTQLAGHLVFADLARSANGSHQDRCREIVRTAARSREHFLPSDTAMSDAVFMCGPLLVEGERYDAAIEFLQAMRKLRVRDDGLYLHGHLCDAAWGRGNGFPAVGVAWCLSAMPNDHSAREDLLEAFRSHMAALAKHQASDGMWHQVIDVPGSYAEFSATAMIGFAMQRGVSRGWLKPQEYQPRVDKAWAATCDRIDPGGKLRGVCEGTGTQPSLEAYLNRKAIQGVDPRGGAMALLFATERMAAK